MEKLNLVREAYEFVEAEKKTKEGRINYPTTDIEMGGEVIFYSEDLPGRECKGTRSRRRLFLQRFVERISY